MTRTVAQEKLQERRPDIGLGGGDAEPPRPPPGDANDEGVGDDEADTRRSRPCGRPDRSQCVSRKSGLRRTDTRTAGSRNWLVGWGEKRQRCTHWSMNVGVIPGKVGMQKIGAGRLMGTILTKLYWTGP